jgi:Tc toxin complex TcA C-terminal TcB-binding domain
MRPELDQTQFIQFNYWDTGHQGLLAGEALHLDIKRMEMAYHDNKRELELTKHVSLRQLDPLALLTLRLTGSCTVTVPEWLYNRDCPGHYMRRIKSVRLSVPSVVGPYTSVNCTLTLQSSSIRTSPLLANGVYARSTTQEDDRFTNYFGSTDVIVTSSGTADSGMFETNLKDERFLPFEGHGAISAWKLSLPPLPQFDYI